MKLSVASGTLQIFRTDSLMTLIEFSLFFHLPMLQTHYVLLLCSFKEQLQQHVRFHAMEAVYACWEIEQSLQSLTGDFQTIESGNVLNI